LKAKLISFIFYILFWIPSGIVFFLVYSTANRLFQERKFPYPFELFGLAAGLGAAFWVYAVVKWLKKLGGHPLAGGK